MYHQYHPTTTVICIEPFETGTKMLKCILEDGRSQVTSPIGFESCMVIGSLLALLTVASDPF